MPPFVHKKHQTQWIDYYLQGNPDKLTPKQILEKENLGEIFEESFHLTLTPGKEAPSYEYLISRVNFRPCIAIYIRSGSDRYKLREIVWAPERTMVMEGVFHVEDTLPVFRYRVKCN